MSARTSASVYATARAEGRAALVGYLPAGFPSYDGCVAAMTAMVVGRSRHRRDRPALLRPRARRPDDPGGRGHRAAQQDAHDRRAAHRRSGRRDGRCGAGHDLLEPGAALRRRAVRRRPRIGRRHRPHHSRPDSRRGGGVDRGQRRARAGTRLPRGAVVVRRPHRVDHSACRGWVYAASTMGVTGARATTSSVGAADWSSGCAPRPTFRSASASASPTATRRRRSRRTPMA